MKDAVDVYIYGYPLVTMDMTRRQMTNVSTGRATRAYGPDAEGPDISAVTTTL